MENNVSLSQLIKRMQKELSYTPKKVEELLIDVRNCILLDNELPTEFTEALNGLNIELTGDLKQEIFSENDMELKVIMADFDGVQVVVKEPEPVAETPEEPVAETPEEPEVETPAEPETPKFNAFGDNKKNVHALEVKVNGIIEKFECEENPLLRQVMAVRIKMLQAKIENQIKLASIRKAATGKRADIALTRNSDAAKQAGLLSKLEMEIATLETQIEEGKKSIDPKYNPNSDKFIMKSVMKRVGGIEETLKLLDANEDGKITADKIRQAMENEGKNVNPELEKRLAEARKKLATVKTRMQTEGLTNAKNVAAAMTTETGLIVAQEGKSIWSRIKNFGKTVVERAGDYIEERKQRKALAQQEAQALADLDEEEKEMLAAYRAALRKDINTKKEMMKGIYREDRETTSTTRIQGQAAAFRSDLHHVTNPTEVLPRGEGEGTPTPVATLNPDGLEPGEDD